MLDFPSDYFKAEIREDFEVSSMMKRAWAAELEVLEVVKKICKDNNITYFAHYGTLLGAVRHKGFIPWDDDIDICLLRPDYNKLIELLPKVLPKGFSLAGMYANSLRLQNAAVIPNARIIADEEQWNFNDYMKYFHGFPYQRVGIDIFPLDYISRDPKFLNFQQTLMYETLSILLEWEELTKNNELEVKISELEKKCGKVFNRDVLLNNNLWRFFDALCCICRENEADEVAFYAAYVVYKKRQLKKNCYLSSEEVPFENTTINIPSGYDEILTTIYNDYMNPRRGTAAHSYPFYGHMEDELITQIRNTGFKGSVDEFCNLVSTGQLTV